MMRGKEGVVAMPGSISDIQGDIFYIEHRAPYEMPNAHVHGHIELNYLVNCSATYWINGELIYLPQHRLAIFWANLPHQLMTLHGEGMLYNLYIPLPEFLQWPLSDALRQQVMNGEMILTTEDHHFLSTRLQRWLDDYLCGEPQLREITLGEISLMVQRVSVLGWENPAAQNVRHETFNAFGEINVACRVKGAHHVSKMLHFIGENLHQPISTADVAQHVGLHKNYTTNMFTQVMGISIKQYLQFQRLQKAQMLLMDNSRAVSDVAYDCGFSSLSRFYEAFARYFGMPPGQFRKQLMAPVISE